MFSAFASSLFVILSLSFCRCLSEHYVHGLCKESGILNQPIFSEIGLAVEFRFCEDLFRYPTCVRDQFLFDMSLIEWSLGLQSGSSFVL